MNKLIEAEVSLNRMLYPKSGHQDGDYGIASMYVDKEIEGEVKKNEIWNSITVIGNMPKLKLGVSYTLKAEEEYNDKYKSYQYIIKYIGIPLENNTREGQRTFLEAILTEKQVEALFEKFENPLEEIKNENIEGLCSIKGIKQKTANDIIEKVRNNLDYSSVYIELDKYELTSKMILKLIEKYKSPDTVINKIKENPYLLATEIDGIGFKKADEIALKGGIEKDSKSRVGAFILYYLKEQAIGGRSYIPQTELMTSIIENLDFDTNNSQSMDRLRETIYELKEEEKLWWDKNKSIMGLTYYLNLEYAIAKEIFRISNGVNKFFYNKWRDVVKDIEEEQGWEYTVEQTEGVGTSLEKNVVLVTGLAGTGKTTVTKAVTKILEKHKIGQCALSGRASQRIAESTGKKASTIHKLLKITNGKALYNENNPLDYDVIILDEASMVGLEIFLLLLKAIKTGTKLIILGDYGQLSSIGAGNVFMDMLESGVISLVRLTTIHRQAQASAITSKSIAVRNQEQLFSNSFEGNMILGELKDLELVIKKNEDNLLEGLIKKFEQQYNRLEKDMHKLQIIVATKQRGKLCCAVVNKAIQEKFNHHSEDEGITVKGDKGYQYSLFEEDKVIVTKNKYKMFTTSGEETSVFNGNLGTITDIDTNKQEVVVDIIGGDEVVFKKSDLNSLELGYAITCHKLQGSSANTVIVAVDFSGYSLLSCEWLYTALTRAEKYCILYGLNKAIRTAISKVETKRKATFLPFALKGVKKEDL